MEYTKPPLSFEAEADRLLKRGLKADRAILIERLQSVNDYRLSGYLCSYQAVIRQGWLVQYWLILVLFSLMLQQQYLLLQYSERRCERLVPSDRVFWRAFL